MILEKITYIIQKLILLNKMGKFREYSLSFMIRLEKLLIDMVFFLI